MYPCDIRWQPFEGGRTSLEGAWSRHDRSMIYSFRLAKATMRLPSLSQRDLARCARGACACVAAAEQDGF